MNWIPVYGSFKFADTSLQFAGKQTNFKDEEGKEQAGVTVGLAICERVFSGGEIRATVRFRHITDRNACSIVFYFESARQWFVSAGIGGAGTMCFIRHWEGAWKYHASTGEKENLEVGRDYGLGLIVRGSRAILSIDDVEVLNAVVPFQIPPSQVGIHCMDDDEIIVSDFAVKPVRGRVFTVMQFSSPFTEIYEDVIRRVVDEFSLEAHRADETFGPGLVIADVAREIAESEFVIANITTPNPNVYYEIGYAHAINKPVILLADRTVERLPFDVSGFRVLYYENSIIGKSRFETGLRGHIAAILHRTTIVGRSGRSA